MSASINSLQEGQNQTIQNVKTLQDTENGLYKQLEAAIAANSDTATQDQIIAQINKIKDMRVSQFSSLNNMSDELKKNVSGTLNKFIDEMSDSVVVVQNELNKSDERLNKIEELKNNKLRMAEINTYYGKQYRENAKTMKTIIYVCVPIIILLILKKKQLLPEAILNTLITLILIIGGVIILKKVVTNTFMRDNMNYDEINQLIATSTPDSETVIQYDMRELKGTNILNDIDADAGYLASKLGFACIGSSCCSDGMMFDKTEKKCVEIKPFNAGVNAEYQGVTQ
jgi:hypothetical protein